MFREIRTSEKIKTRKENELDWLYKQLFDCRIGSEKWYQIKARIDDLEKSI